jgi:hypothetical protein
VSSENRSEIPCSRGIAGILTQGSDPAGAPGTPQFPRRRVLRSDHAYPRARVNYSAPEVGLRPFQSLPHDVGFDYAGDQHGFKLAGLALAPRR